MNINFEMMMLTQETVLLANGTTLLEMFETFKVTEVLGQAWQACIIVNYLK